MTDIGFYISGFVIQFHVKPISFFYKKAGVLGCLFAAVEIRASTLKNFVAIHRGKDGTFQAKKKLEHFTARNASH